MQFLGRCRVAGGEAVIATVIQPGDVGSAQTGDRFYVTSGWTVSGPLVHSPLQDALLRHVGDVFRARKRRNIWIEAAGVFIVGVGRWVPHGGRGQAGGAGVRGGKRDGGKRGG